MARQLRGPLAGRLVEVTCRTLHSRLLLRPSPTVNATLKGILARGQRRYGMTVCAVVAVSNHVHLLLVPQSTEQLADFMRYVNSNVARKIGRHHGWSQRFWGRRYQVIPVSDEEAAHVGRLRYLLSHGAKDPSSFCAPWLQAWNC